ncbi:MAG: alpha/beta hydrolase [Deltaproteobacteria bacterium]|nr:alpha/beta hydrolase [Deltaproteobacteria bacterium]
MSSRTPQIEAWTNDAGERFRQLSWSKEGSENLLFIQHGLGEHGGRYQTLADALDDVDANIASFDSRGHGESVGKRGDAEGLAGLAADLQVQLDLAIERFQPKRVILLGHSMGGAALAYALLNSPEQKMSKQLVGAIFSAPAVSVYKTLDVKITLGIGSLLGKVMPTLTIGSGIDPSTISSDPSQVRRYVEDPLIHDRITARMGVSLVGDGEICADNAERITLPALVYQGQDDHIVPAEGTQRFAERLGSSDKTIHLFKGSRHEVHHETPEKAEELFEVLRVWLTTHFVD